MFLNKYPANSSQEKPFIVMVLVDLKTKQTKILRIRLKVK